MDAVEPVVECTGLRKKYRGKWAIAGVDARFARGTTVVLGANGAGKTTLLSMLATVIKPTAGVITVDSMPVRGAAGVEHARALIGFLPQRFDIMRGAKVEENVSYASWAHGTKAGDVGACAARALRAVGLEDRRNERARVLSGGQRQRLGIACAMAHEPAILILDEPSVGLDPIQRSSLRNLIGNLATRTAVILSTHLVDDAARLGRQALVLRDGATVFDGATSSLLAGQSDTGDKAQALEAALLELLQ